jgi:hypothetical protein
MDVERIQQEMRALAEARIDMIAGPDAILLPKNLAAKVCGKSVSWIDQMVAADDCQASESGDPTGSNGQLWSKP